MCCSKWNLSPEPKACLRGRSGQDLAALRGAVQEGQGGCGEAGRGALEESQRRVRLSSATAPITPGATGSEYSDLAAQTPELCCHAAVEASGLKCRRGQGPAPPGEGVLASPDSGSSAAPWLVAASLQPLPPTPPGPPSRLHIFSLRMCASVSLLTSHVGWRAHGPQRDLLLMNYIYQDPISKGGPVLKIQVDVNHWGT